MVSDGSGLGFSSFCMTTSFQDLRVIPISSPYVNLAYIAKLSSIILKYFSMFPDNVCPARATNALVNLGIGSKSGFFRKLFIFCNKTC